MTITLALPWIVTVIGAGVYVFAPGKPGELGRYAFLAGLLAALLEHGR